MWADHLTGVADILASTSDGGEVLVNLGDTRDNSGIAAEAPMWGVDGFVSRPNDPDEAGACEALYVVDGDEKRVVATRDMRFAEQVGTLQPGDRAIFTDGEPRLLVKKAKNSIVLYTLNVPADLSMMVELNGEEGTLKLINGGSWIEIAADRVTIGADGGKATLTVDASGVSLVGAHFAANTGGGNLGVLAAPPLVPPVPPVPVANSILLGPTGMAGVPSSKWVVSPL